jgi:protein-disulfide isomerase
VFRHFPLETLHRNARYAAAAAACAASSGKFWDMHRLLFANQRGLNRDNVLSYLAEIDAKNECADKADFEVARDVAEGEPLGVSSTPTFFIGEVTSKDEIAIRVKFSGAYPFTVISAEIDKLVAAKN